MNIDAVRAVDSEPTSETYGHPILIGQTVRHKDGRTGEVDRVGMSDGTLYVWFGTTQSVPGGAPMRVVEEVPCADAEVA